jgi:hypothetical protein
MQRLFPLFAFGIVVLAGCTTEPRLVSVKGKVTYDGVPVESGLVHFQAADGTSPSAKGGAIIKGEYAAEVPVGELIVKITGMKATGEKKKAYAPDSPWQDVTVQYLPEKYNTETLLRVTVEARKDDLDFKLEK